MAKVLLIEDTPMIRKLLAAVLSSNGFEVIESEHGEQAFRQLKEGTPDIIICDIEMPVMDGRTFVREFRCNPAYNNIPLVILSADSAEGVARELLKIGATKIVDKATPPQALVDVLNSLIHA